MGRDIKLEDDLKDYVYAHMPDEPEALAQVRRETDLLGEKALMQIGWLQANFMQVLARLIGARSYLELGTFRGYSALAMALAMPADARIVTFDVNEEMAPFARAAWMKSGVDSKIDQRLMPAAEGLSRLLDEGQAGCFDMAFIDADKCMMVDYCNACRKLVRPGGLIIADNTLFAGNVINQQDTRERTGGIRAFNDWVGDQDGLRFSLLPVGDGMTLIVN